jgi:hypothetical protein
MRLSHLFFSTLRDDPSDAEMPSHRLLLRAGYMRQLGAGIYSLLPLGVRANKRVEQVIREELNAIGGQEMEMPVVHPAEVWKESGRYAKIGPELARFKDRGERDMVLAMTHEEVVAILLRDVVRSYRQLPIIVYHFQTKFRDEPRARGGLIRVREFVMKDSYSCDVDYAGLSLFSREGSIVVRTLDPVGVFGDKEEDRPHYILYGTRFKMPLNAPRYPLVMDATSLAYTARRLAKEAGLFTGPSSGGACWAALQVAKEVDQGVIVFIACDRGDRYLSSDLFR